MHHAEQPIRPSACTVSDTLNALYACSEIGFEDKPTLLTASRMLISLTALDPSAFTAEEAHFIVTQVRDAEYYTNSHYYNNLRNGDNR